MNPLLTKFDTPFGSVPFDLIKEEHYLPAMNQGIELAKKEIEAIKQNAEGPTFQNTIVELEGIGEILSQATSVFFNLNSANTNDELQKLAREISPMLSAYGNDIMLDAELFARVKSVYGNKENFDLTEEDTMLLEKTYKGFVRNGALLSEDAKNKVRDIDAELSKLSLEFGEHNLAEAKKYKLVISNENDLEGMPEGVIEAASMTAKEKGDEGKWAFTLDYPSYGPFMTYCKNTDLRKELSFAMGTKSAKDDELDNREIVKRITILRHNRASLLGYASHSNFILEERMAGNPETVLNFLNDILTKARPAAVADLDELKAFALKLDNCELQSWDVAYYTEKLKKEKLNFDDEMLRPYFKIENVVDGVFQVANKLYGLTLEEKNLPTYHEETKVFEVKYENGEHVGLLYTDFFPRAGKRAGAWATSYRSQQIKGSENIRPHASIVCNFTKPTETRPSLLTFREVQTLFHEFGHALHTLLANTKYSELSGTSVFWDFVELPSQILENWTFEKECLDLFAVHYETGETIPEDLVNKLKSMLTFREGTNTLRQVALARLDMAWYSQDPSDVLDVEQFEIEVGKDTALMPHTNGTCVSTSFGHIFAGGYSSGYYSYKWAEVLDADAFEQFKKNGIFNREIATKFKDNILSRGGTKHPMELYKGFRGEEPSVDPLLRRGGLI
ncbi:MAG: M3 family metallopeptidase [Bacteriovoracaceae bacterium]|nr:M3 family metallopeptidase [Bacteriovoracaceae bacterium]